MVRRWLALAALTILATFVQAKPLPEKAVPFSAEQFERLAQDLPFFCSSDFFAYGRLESIHFRWEMPPALAMKHREILAQATAHGLPVKELASLLKHPDPKVRMLAIAALVNQGQPKLLPQIALLVDDRALGLPTPKFTPRAYIAAPPPPQEPPPMKPQTVGDVARLALKAYLHAASIHPRDDEPAKFKSEFADYWAQRKDRDHCASWTLVRVTRAAKGTSAVSKESIAALRAIRADVDRLPAPDRAWTLLWVGSRVGEYFAPYFAAEKEVVQAGKFIGPQKLLAMLEGGNPSGDPDLKVRHGMPRFVLRHAVELLDPDMADHLIELGRAANDHTSDWDVAAAQLDPLRGDAILQAALARLTYEYGGQARAELAVALWQCCGLHKTDALLDWFYTEKQKAAFGYFYSRGHFVREVGKADGADVKTLLAKLIADPRFAKCDWQSVLALNERVSRWTKEPVIGEHEIRNSNPAAGADFEMHLENARKMYPKETERSLQILAERRERLRKSVPEWAPRP